MTKRQFIELPVIQGTPTKDLPFPRDERWNEQAKKPGWLKVKFRSGESYEKIRKMTKGLRLNTVCQEARCPNIYECWSEGTATFMVMGDTCTRACGFCAVKTGIPNALDPDEPEHVAEAVKTMGVAHAVITSVDRDDLLDLGAGHFAAVIRAVRVLNPLTKVEVLIPDFQGKPEHLVTILEARPDVLNHNTETVPRLHRRVRSRARYEWTLGLLKQAAEYRDRQAPEMFTKTGLMLGLGEGLEEVLHTIEEIREQGTDILTVGQYMRPTLKHLPVERYWTPQEFEHIGQQAKKMGFRFVESGPLVRSSYHAGRHRHGALNGPE